VKPTRGAMLFVSSFDSWPKSSKTVQGQGRPLLLKTPALAAAWSSEKMMFLLWSKAMPVTRS
jgi:hypothetical protein